MRLKETLAIAEKWDSTAKDFAAAMGEEPAWGAAAALLDLLSDGGSK